MKRRNSWRNRSPKTAPAKWPTGTGLRAALVPLTTSELDTLTADLTGGDARLAQRRATLRNQLADYFRARMDVQEFPPPSRDNCLCRKCQEAREKDAPLASHGAPPWTPRPGCSCLQCAEYRRTGQRPAGL